MIHLYESHTNERHDIMVDLTKAPAVTIDCDAMAHWNTTVATHVHNAMVARRFDILQRHIGRKGPLQQGRMSLPVGSQGLVPRESYMSAFLDD